MAKTTHPHTWFHGKALEKFSAIPVVLGIIGFGFYATLACYMLFPNIYGLIFGVFIGIVESGSRIIDVIASIQKVPEKNEKEKRRRIKAFFKKPWVQKAWYFFRGIFLVATIVTFTMRYKTIFLAISPTISPVVWLTVGLFMSMMMAVSLIFYTDEILNRLSLGSVKKQEQKRLKQHGPTPLQRLTGFFIRGVNAIIAFVSGERDPNKLDRLHQEFQFFAQATNYGVLTTISFHFLLPISPFNFVFSCILGMAFAIVTYIDLKMNLDYAPNDVSRQIATPKLHTWESWRNLVIATSCNIISTGVLFTTLYVGFHVYIPMIAAVGFSVALFQGLAIASSIGFAYTLWYITQQVIIRWWMQQGIQAYEMARHNPAFQDKLIPTFDANSPNAQNWYRIHAAHWFSWPISKETLAKGAALPEGKATKQRASSNTTVMRALPPCQLFSDTTVSDKDEPTTTLSPLLRPTIADDSAKIPPNRSELTERLEVAAAKPGTN